MFSSKLVGPLYHIPSFQRLGIIMEAGAGCVCVKRLSEPEAVDDYKEAG